MKGVTRRVYSVSVIGMSAKCGQELDGVGKSCLCNRFVRPAADQYHSKHISIVTETEFAGQVLRSSHWVYWGRADRLHGHQFHVVEQTEFCNENLRQFGPAEPYHQRCAATKLNTSQKLAWVCSDQLGFEEDYPKQRAPEGSLLISGFLVCFDLSKNFEQQRRFLRDVAPFLGQAKRPALLVATKCDLLGPEAHARGLEALRKEYKHHHSCFSGLVETSAKLNVNVEEAFRYLAACVDKDKARSKPLPYQEALNAACQQAEVVEINFQQLLQATVPAHSVVLNFDAWYAVHEADCCSFVRLHGGQKARDLFERELCRQRKSLVEQRRRQIAERLHAFLAVVYPTVECRPQLDNWERVVTQLLASERREQFVVKVTQPWRESLDYLASSDTRVPYSFLLSQEDSWPVFREYQDRLEGRQRSETFASQLVAALQERPDRRLSLEELQRSLPGWEQLSCGCSPAEVAAGFEEARARLQQMAVRDFLECLQEQAALLYRPPAKDSAADDAAAAKKLAKAVKRDPRHVALQQALQPDAAKELVRQQLDFAKHRQQQQQQVCWHRDSCFDALAAEAVAQYRPEPSEPTPLNLLLLGSESATADFVRACRSACAELHEGAYQLDEGASQLHEGAYQLDEGVYEQHENVYEEHENLYEQHDSVYDQRGTVHEQRGNVHDQRGTVHDQRGTVHDQRGTVHDQRGTVHDQRGTVHDQRGDAQEQQEEVQSIGGRQYVVRFHTPRQHSSQLGCLQRNSFAGCALVYQDSHGLDVVRSFVNEVPFLRSQALAEDETTYESLGPSPPTSPHEQQELQHPILDDALLVCSMSSGNEGPSAEGKSLANSLRCRYVECSSRPEASRVSRDWLRSVLPLADASAASQQLEPRPADLTLLVSFVCGDAQAAESACRLLRLLGGRGRVQRLSADTVATDTSGGLRLHLRLASQHRAWRLLHARASWHGGVVVFQPQRRASVACASALANGLRQRHLPLLLAAAAHGAAVPDAAGARSYRLQLDAADPSAQVQLTCFLSDCVASRGPLQPAPEPPGSDSSGGWYYQPCPDDDADSVYSDAWRRQRQQRTYDVPEADTMSEVYAAPPDAPLPPRQPPESTYSVTCDARPAAGARRRLLAPGAVNPAFSDDAASLSSTTPEASARPPRRLGGIFGSGRFRRQQQVPSNQQQLPSNQQQLPSNQQQLPSNQQQLPSNQQQLPSNQAPEPLPQLSWPEVARCPDRPLLPAFVAACVQFVEADESRLRSEGLYRTSGSAYDVCDLAERLLAPGCPPLDSLQPPPSLCTVASALKQLLAKLSPSVLPGRLLRQLAAASHSSVGALLASELRPEALATLRYLLAHLQRVAERADANRMTAYNLAVCWAPTLLVADNPLDLLQHKERLGRLLQALIHSPKLLPQ